MSLVPSLALRNVAIRRTFSSTIPVLKVHGLLPTFVPTSNPELDALLNEIREELFIPAHLLQRHRSLIYRKKNHAILEEEPLHVDISGQTVTLTPKTRQKPVRTAAFTQCLNLMKTPQDLDAIPGLIEGWAQLKRPFWTGQLQKVARVVTLQGRTDLLMQLARGAGTHGGLGFKFNGYIARELMRGIRIQNSQPDKPTVVKSLKNAEQLIDLFGERTHLLDGMNDLQKDPVVLGLMLGMYASTNKRFNDGKDYDFKVQNYTIKLQNVWSDTLLDLDLEIPKPKLSSPSAHLRWRLKLAKDAIVDWKPVLGGMAAAKNILEGTKPAEWLGAEVMKLQEAIESWEEFVKNNTKVDRTRRSPDLYRRAAEEMAERATDAGQGAKKMEANAS